ncbi:DNA polymerase III subunit beta [Xanthobacter sp.]|uniref:DNA polymerase III subunit beta n=1 Tax=Xanthobacter sp. TaxID=35809 RepID=UPI0025F56066|nr:DNA polymerase III subunit beta [Xanthobacter sp.]
MILTLERDAFLAALERLAKVVEKRTTIPILANVKMVARKGGIELRGSDLDMEIATTIAGEIEAAGEATFPHAIARDYARKLPAGAKVALKLAGDRLAISSGRSRVSVPVLPAEDFPNFAAAAGDFHLVEIPASDLLTLLDRVSFCISTEETRYYLNGIYLHVVTAEDGALRLRGVATDGHRLGMHDAEVPALPAGMPGVIVPRKAVEEMARLLKPLGEGKVSLAVRATTLVLVAGITTMSTKLVDGTFPDYERVVPRGNPHMARLAADELASAVDRVAAVCSDKSRAVRFHLEAGKLTLSVNNPETGEASDELEAEYGAAPLTIGFNGRYVLDMLGAQQGKAVAMAFADPGSPCLITPEGASGSLFVIMPMRV